MSTMTHTTLSDCPYPESTAYNIRDEIDATITRLKVVIDEEASLRKALRALFVKRKEEAIEQVRLANLHLDLVNEEEATLCDDLIRAAASANAASDLELIGHSHAYYQAPIIQGLDMSGIIDNVAKIELATSPSIPTPAVPAVPSPATPKSNLVEEDPILRAIMANQHDANDHIRPPRVPSLSPCILDSLPPRRLAKSPVDLLDWLTRSPAISSPSLNPRRSPVRSARRLADNSTTSQERFTHEEPATEDADDWFAAAPAMSKKLIAPKLTPQAKRAAKAKKPNLLSMPTEELA